MRWLHLAKRLMDIRPVKIVDHQRREQHERGVPSNFPVPYKKDQQQMRTQRAAPRALASMPSLSESTLRGQTLTQ